MIPAGLDANDLMLFQRVADAGSLSRAAEQSGLPRSYVSRHLAALEARLGERLFHRSTRKLALTDFGLGLLRHTRDLSDSMAQIDNYVTSRSGLPSGRLRVSIPPDFADPLLPADFFADFMTRYPDIRLDIDVSARRVDVIGEQFDLAIRASRNATLPDDATLVARPLYAHSWAPYASPAYLQRYGVPSHPDQLAQHAILALSSASSGQARTWTLTQRETKAFWQGLPTARLQCNSMALLVNMAVHDQGIAMLGVHHVQAVLAQAGLQRILPDWESPPSQTWLIMPGRRLIPTSVRVFIDALEAALAL